jgi:tetratricopeptide (TPR) repeat protein
MSRLAQPGLAIASLLALSPGARGDGKPPPAESAYFEALTRKGIVERGAGTAAELKQAVLAAQVQIATGEAQRAATRLYGLVEGPRYADLADSDDFQNAEYLLGVALAKGGAAISARRYLERLAARQGSPYAEPALRKLVDLALDAHDATAAANRLEQAGVRPPDGPLKMEVDYLRGRGAYEQRHWDVAEDELKRVGPTCRFYSSAIYLRGVMAASRGDLGGASDDFCVIADVKPDDPLQFVVDGRYFTVRDLARLALGRIAHEQGRYDDALYHYFTIPEDSESLPRALYESAWSMLQAKKWDLARRLTDELLREFPNAPIAGEGRLLRATLAVKTCRFHEAGRGFDEFLREYEPVEALVESAERDPAARRALARRLLTGKPDTSDSVEGRVLRMLSMDPAFFRLRDFARGLRADADDAAGVAAAWESLEGRLAGTRVQAVSAAKGADDAAELLERVGGLGNTISGVWDQVTAIAESNDPRPAVRQHAKEELTKLAQLEKRRIELAAKLRKIAQERAPAPATGGSLPEMASRDRQAAQALRVRAAQLAEKLDARQGELLGTALGGLKRKLESMLRQARLGNIDSLIGQKKKLEQDIEALAAGRFPAQLASRMSIEGLIADDEEYWPAEKEEWADEYEGYK